MFYKRLYLRSHRYAIFFFYCLCFLSNGLNKFKRKMWSCCFKPCIQYGMYINNRSISFVNWLQLPLNRWFIFIHYLMAHVCEGKIQRNVKVLLKHTINDIVTVNKTTVSSLEYHLFNGYILTLCFNNNNKILASNSVKFSIIIYLKINNNSLANAWR